MDSHRDPDASSSKKNIITQTGLTALCLPLVPRFFKTSAVVSNNVMDKVNPHAQALLKGGARTNKAEIEENMGKNSFPVFSAFIDLALLPAQKVDLTLASQFKKMNWCPFIKAHYQLNAGSTFTRSIFYSLTFTKGFDFFKNGYEKIGVFGHVNEFAAMASSAIFAAVMGTPMENINKIMQKNSKIINQSLEASTVFHEFQQIAKTKDFAKLTKDMSSNLKTNIVAAVVIDAIRHRDRFFTYFPDRQVDETAVENVLGLSG